MPLPRYQTPSSYIGKLAAVYPKPAGSVNRSAAIPPLPTRVSGSPAIVGVVDPSVPKQSAEEFIREQANRYIQSQIDAINAQKQAYLDDLKAQSDLEMQRGQELSRALTGLNMPGHIQDIYNNASANIGGLAQAFSGTLRDTAQADTAAQQRMLSGTGQEGAVRNDGVALGDVTYGSQGYIPAKSMGETGAAFAAQAALEPGFAQRIGQVKAGDVYSAGLDNLRQFTDAILQAEGGRSEIESNLSKQYSDAQKTNLTSKTLANGQIQFFNEDTGEPVGAPQGPKRSTKSAGGVNLQARTLANGQVQWFNPKTGKAVGKPVGPPRPEKDSSTKLQARSLANGQIQWFDPATGQPVGGPQGPKRAVTKKGAGGSGGYNLQLKTLPNGSQQWFDPRTGKAVGAPVSPPKTGTAAKYTPAKLAEFKNNAGKIASQAWNGVKVTQEVNGEKVTGMQHLSYQEAMREGLARGIPLSIMQQSLNRYWTKPGFDKDFQSGKWVKQATGRPLHPFQERHPQKKSTTEHASYSPEGLGQYALQGAKFTNLGGPDAHHARALGNWQSDNAYDLGVPEGTPVYAMTNGTIGPNVGPMQERPGDGQRLTLNGADNNYWYGHLSQLTVKAGQHVKAGQLIGYSGHSANGVPHLHLGIQYLPGYGSRS